jgi:hypothetical protein
MGRRDDDLPIPFRKLGHRLTVARDDRLERLALAPFRMLGGKLAHSIECESGLRIKGMFDPERAILIESGNAILRLDVVAARLVCHFPDEGNDCLFCRPVVPRRKPGSLSVGVGVDSQHHCTKHQYPRGINSETAERKVYS